jgi:hypothetical protein
MYTMFSRIPINKNPLLTEWFNTGLHHGTFSAWHHGKHHTDSPCRCAEMLEASVEWLKKEEDWKVFITRDGWLAGFAVGRDQEVSPSLLDDQAEGDLHA